MLNVSASTAGLSALRPLEAFGKRVPNAQANVLNRVGTRTRAQVIPVLARQTGLTTRIITKAVRMGRASPANPRVMLVTRGGNISLRFFGAREVTAGAQAGPVSVKHGGRTFERKSGKGSKGGVLARIRGKDTLFSGAFRRSGPAGNRRLVAKLNGATYLNDDGGKWRGRMHSIRSGVYIPVDLVTGETEKTFWRVVERDLPAEVERELLKLLPGRG